MAKNIQTGETCLVDRKDFTSSTELVAVSKGNVISEGHRRKISEFVAGMVKTEEQKSSARKLMHGLCNDNVTCDCCGNVFNRGNYHKHVNNISTKGRKASEEQKSNQRRIMEEKNKLLGAVRSIYTVDVGGTFYVIYDVVAAAMKFGVSLPTFRKKTRPVEVGSHRNRTIVKLYVDVDVSGLEIFEDCFVNNAQPHPRKP